jgi:CheY-like chemotaxis protein
MPANGRILVVDDDPILRAIACEMLQSNGFVADQAEDGAVALEWLKTNVADLVVMDMLMPNKEGIETILELKQAWPRVRIIAISGGAGVLKADELLRMAQRLGADAVMTKPLFADPFIALVRRLLGGDARAVA